MNKVKRAIIVAAGKGERMQPITLTTPKPLVKVNSTAMIETIIDALHKNGIYEIYIVVGYLKEQFEYLRKKYDSLTLIENPFYDSCNNISSLYAARDYIEDAFILDGDQVILNPQILNPIFDRSGYNCVYTKEHTNEWLLKCSNGIIESCSRCGGNNGYQLYSISRWCSKDAKKLKKLLEAEFIEKKNTQIYWDDVAMFCYPEEFELGIYEMSADDIIEIDSISELEETQKKLSEK